jgi:hypothetical protein
MCKTVRDRCQIIAARQMAGSRLAPAAKCNRSAN